MSSLLKFSTRSMRKINKSDLNSKIVPYQDKYLKNKPGLQIDYMHISYLKIF